MGGRLKGSVFKFKPFSRKQKKVLTWWLPESGVSNADGVIADGAIRSGKTVCMALSFVMWSMDTFNEQNFGLCGKTVGSFRRNVLSVLKQMLNSRGYTFKDKRSENLFIISRGAVTNYYYIFGGKDESSQDLIQGITLAGVLFDEVALMPESFVNQAMGRCSVDGSKYWFNCNPEGPEHWFKKGFIDGAADKRLLYLHFRMSDNLSLSAEVLRRYASYWTGVFYRRYILGEWCMAEGLVYSEFDPEKNVVDGLPEAFQQFGTWYMSIDYGTLNPFSCGLWCVYKGHAIRVREYYYSGRESGHQLTDEEYYSEVEKLAGNLPIMHIVIDPSAASFIATIRRHGRFSVRKARNEVIPGISLTATMLKYGIVKISRNCGDALREFGLYRWDEDSTEDRVIKDNDHCLTGDTLVDTLTGQKPIKTLVGKVGLVWSYNGKKKVLRPYYGVRKTRINQPVLKITLENGKQVKCTPDHRILTESGWVRAKYLDKSSKILDIMD